MRAAIHATIVSLLLVTSLRAQATGPSTELSLPEGPLQITITGIEIVQARTGPDQPWKRAMNNMVLSEGAEFRTGPRSAVRFTIPPDQTVTLDRLGTVQVLRSNFQNGKILTDLGMKYGRTRYDIEAAGREHEATVRSPSSVLAVRGTQVSLYDQPPFVPQAVSLTGRAMFKDAHKQIAFGGKGAGKTKVAEDKDSSTDHAIAESSVNPQGIFSGHTGADDLRNLSFGYHGGNNLGGISVLGLFDQLRSGQFSGTFISTLYIEQQLRFLISWPNASGADVDLSVISPSKEIVSSANPQSPSGGFHLGNAVGEGTTVAATETVIWAFGVPVGSYTVKIDLKPGSSKGPVTVASQVDDPLVSLPDSGGKFPNVINQQPVTLSTAKPSVSIPIVVKQKPAPGALARLTKVR